MNFQNFFHHQMTSVRPEQLVQQNESYFHNLNINWDWLSYHFFLFWNHFANIFLLTFCCFCKINSSELDWALRFPRRYCCSLLYYYWEAPTGSLSVHDARRARPTYLPLPYKREEAHKEWQKLVSLLKGSTIFVKRKTKI